MLHDTQVFNVDDIYGNDVKNFVCEINEYIAGLASVSGPDICNFQVSRVDYCFNIWTPHVKAYLDVMNAGFKLSNNGTRINYVQEKKLSGSVYVKTKRDYKDNTRRNYVLNYYDKKNRLEYLQKRKLRIYQPDWARAENILRLEVQCGFQFIKELCKNVQYLTFVWRSSFL